MEGRSERLRRRAKHLTHGIEDAGILALFEREGCVDHVLLPLGVHAGVEQRIQQHGHRKESAQQSPKRQNLVALAGPHEPIDRPPTEPAKNSQCVRQRDEGLYVRSKIQCRHPAPEQHRPEDKPDAPGPAARSPMKKATEGDPRTPNAHEDPSGHQQEQATQDPEDERLRKQPGPGKEVECTVEHSPSHHGGEGHDPPQAPRHEPDENAEKVGSMRLLRRIRAQGRWEFT